MQYTLVKHISNRARKEKNPSVNLNVNELEEVARESRKGYRFKLHGPCILEVSCSPQSTQNFELCSGKPCISSLAGAR